MNIQGMQKLTLLDYPGKTACTVFTGGCNLRCPFCHNADLVLRGHGSGIPEKGIRAFLELRKKVLEGVCVSGGEPLLQEDLPEFLRYVKDIGYSVKLDTNGTFPEKLSGLISGGLVDYVAMDIKNSPESYAKTVGIKNFDIAPVLMSVDILKNSGVRYEFRTTLVRELHTAEDMRLIAEWLRGNCLYFLQAFVKSENQIEEGLSGFSKDEMLGYKELVRPFVPNVSLRGI